MDARTRDRGSITLIVALFLAALAMSYLSLFDTGQFSREKTQLQRSADAVAYSAAVLQARELNFHAAMNRAMASNQAMIGQMVALSSFFQVNQQIWWELSKAGKFLRPVPVFGQIFAIATTVIEGGLGLLNMGLQQAASAFTKGADLLIGALSNASQLWHAHAVVSLPVALREISQRNEPAASLSLAGTAITGRDLARWYRFTERFKVDVADPPKSKTRAGNRRDRIRHRERFREFHKVVMENRDPFTVNRSHDFWELDLGFKIEMRQRGGTHMGTLKGRTQPWYSWSAVDTLSLWRRKWESWRPKMKESIPLAWGRQATFHPRGDFRWSRQGTNWGGALNNRDAYRLQRLRDRYGQGFFEGPRYRYDHIGHFKVGELGENNGLGALRSADPRMQPRKKSAEESEIKGLRNFRDLAESNSGKKGSKADERVNAATPIHILIRKDLENIRHSTSEGFLIRPQSPVSPAQEGQPAAAGRALHVIAAGQAVFEPPSRGWIKGQSWQTANLYNPFWQARLVRSSERIKAAARAAAGHE